MIVDLDELISIEEAARRSRKSVSSIYRFADGYHFGVKLKTVLVGGGRRTTQRFLQEYFAEVTARADEAKVAS